MARTNKRKNNVIFLVIVLTTWSPALGSLTKPKRSWVEIGPNTECDTSAGEVYRKQSPGKGSSLEECKKSCQDEAECQSITYFKSGWCSHYSTPCTKTKTTNKAVALRFSAAPSGSTSTTPNPSQPRGWAPESKAELQAAIVECLKLSTDCSKGPHGPIGSWDVSAVTDMDRMFKRASSFNGDLSKWDVARVTSMVDMFYSASSFNGDLSKWDVSSVTDMNWMFVYATSFNGDLSKWDVSRVTTMVAMFRSASSFNGDLSKWDVSRVTKMTGMFEDASLFDQTLCGAWKSSKAASEPNFELHAPSNLFYGSSGRLC